MNVVLELLDGCNYNYLLLTTQKFTKKKHET